MKTLKGRGKIRGIVIRRGLQFSYSKRNCISAAVTALRKVPLTFSVSKNMTSKKVIALFGATGEKHLNFKVHVNFDCFPVFLFSTPETTSMG